MAYFNTYVWNIYKESKFETEKKKKLRNLKFLILGAKIAIEP